MDAQELAEWRWVYTVEHEEREGKRARRRARRAETEREAAGTDATGAADTTTDDTPE